MCAQPVRYFAPAGVVQVEDIIKRSRFIGTAGPAASEEAARAFITQMRELYADASHNAWAFSIGVGDSAVQGMSDDGEPGGTAGPPILARIKSSGLGDVVVVVTRYFGGIKLGKGGLVRAYGGTAGQALQALEVVEKVRMRTIQLPGISYNQYGPLRGMIEAHGGRVVEEDFGETIALRVVIPLDRVPAFAKAVADLTAGAIQIEEESRG